MCCRQVIAHTKQRNCNLRTYVFHTSPLTTDGERGDGLFTWGKGSYLGEAVVLNTEQDTDSSLLHHFTFQRNTHYELINLHSYILKFFTGLSHYFINTDERYNKDNINSKFGHGSQNFQDIMKDSETQISLKLSPFH